MLAPLKRGIRQILAYTADVPYWYPFVRDVAIVFMFHRFANPDRGVDGLSPEELRRGLAFMRRHGFRFASLRDLLRLGGDAHQPGNSPMALFTVDDGYMDFAEVAVPIFAEFDCPVTLFVTTGPVDRRTWFWWDRVEYAMETTTHTGADLTLENRAFSWRWANAGERRRATVDVTERLKKIPNDHKLNALTELARGLEVDSPVEPPERYAAISWSDVRRCARLGATFGPHTVTHPILPQVPGETAEWEIRESWRRLQEECDAAVPVFAYPNGTFSAREVDILSRSRLAAAVTTDPSYVSRSELGARPSANQFHIPRFSFSSDRVEFVSVVTGLA